jgi:hypothetical protein
VLADHPPAGGAAQIVVDEATFILPLEGVIDISAEQARLTKAAEAAEKERDSLAHGSPIRASSSAQARGGGEGAGGSCREGVGRGEVSGGAGAAGVIACQLGLGNPKLAGLLQERSPWARSRSRSPPPFLLSCRSSEG